MDTTLNQKRHENLFRIGGATLGQRLADSLSSHPLKLTPTGFEAFKVLVTDDVPGRISELDLTGSTFEANVDFFSLQRFQNVRTLRLAKCRKLTDGGPVGERHTSGTGQGPRLEVLDLSECPGIKGMGEVVLEI